MRTWRRRSLICLGAFAMLYVAVCLYFWTFQVEEIFAPMKEVPDTPDELGMAYDRVRIPLGEETDHAELDGFWVPVNHSDAPTFLYLHGRDASIGKNLEHTQRLHQMGYNVLIIDYRGFGESTNTNKLSETTVYEDAEAAWSFLINKQGCRPDQLFIFGHSLGGAIAIELAARHPEAAGLITESTFTSILDMSERKYNGWLRALPMSLLLRHPFDSIEKISDLEVPVLLIHGTSDEKGVPHSMTESLYAAAPEPKEILLIEGGGHANSGSVGWAEYKESISQFVNIHQNRAEQIHDGNGGQRR